MRVLMRTVCLAVLLISGFLLTACPGRIEQERAEVAGGAESRGNLTRDHAKQLVEADPTFTAGTRVLSVPWNAAGMYEQIVKFDGVNSSDVNMAVQPAYQSAVASARQGARGESLNYVFLTLASPLRPAIQSVTGISDGSIPSEKLVDFQWNYTTPPPNVLSPLLPAPPYQGRAVFKKYDDGWRVEQITWQLSGSS